MSPAFASPLFDHVPGKPRNAMSRPLLACDDGSPLPARCVMSFMRDVLDEYVAQHSCAPIASCHSETRDFPLYRTEVEGKQLCLVQAPVGAPAAAILADLLVASGVESLVACGGCGVLKPIPSGMILIPTAALRDEGTSYHYIAPARFIELDPSTVDVALKTAADFGVPFRACLTWTTDGFFRETPELVDLRASQGCETVDMECAALAAVAKAYGIRFAEILYSGDSLCDPEHHDARNWTLNGGARHASFILALSTASRL